ncbi:MAG: response regulator [Chitinophagaceae bacterium]|nr:response regulator [Chitinophagaceae bacterium]
MKPIMPFIKGHPRLKRILAFAAVITVLFVGIGFNFMIESKVLDSVQEHTYKTDSVLQHEKYRQLVEKTMFLMTQNDHHLESYVQTKGTLKLLQYQSGNRLIQNNLNQVKTNYAGYIPKYLVNIFIHKASNRIDINSEILATCKVGETAKALALMNGRENKTNLTELNYSAQELVNTLNAKIEGLNQAVTLQKNALLALDRKWNIVSLIFMLLIAFLVLYKMLETGRLNVRLSAAIKKEHEASLVKDQFISNVTHELRTPLNSIIGYTNLLLKKEYRTEMKQWIYAMKVSGNLLMEVINDVLDYSKLESGYIQFANEPFQLKEVLSNLKNVMQNRADSKNLAFIMDHSGDIPAGLEGDEKKLMQILVNLTGNSVKFTESGHIKLRTSVHKKDEGRVWIQFTITDTGIGIDEKKLPYIFERFYQVDSGLSKKYFGTGLGLPIVKQLVEMQGGTITAASSPGMGTKFQITLPYKIYEGELLSALPEVKQVSAAATTNLQQKEILVVDDNEMNRDLLGFILKEHHYRVETAANGVIAIQMLKQKKYDFVLMDVQMPEMNGMETTRKIRAELKLQTPVIGLSAFSQPEEQQASIHAGMNAYLTKPVDDQKLFELLNYYTDWNAQTDTEHLKLVNIDYLQRITGGSKEYVEEVLIKAVHLLPGEVKKLHDSLEDNNGELLKEIVHNMKTTLSILGVKEIVSNKVRELEKSDLSIPADKAQMKVLAAELDHSVKVVLEELKDYLKAA